MRAAEDDTDEENRPRACSIDEGTDDLGYPEQDADSGQDMNGKDWCGAEATGRGSHGCTVADFTAANPTLHVSETTITDPRESARGRTYARFMNRGALSRLLIRWLAVITVLLAVASTGAVAHAQQRGASAWGWEQMRLPSLSSAQRAVLIDALVAAQPAAKADARRQALALLVTSGAVTPSQADLLAAVNTPSAIQALVASGEFTKARAAAVTQVINGYSRTQARYSAAKFALELLTSTGLLNHAQAEEVRAQLGSIH